MADAIAASDGDSTAEATSTAPDRAGDADVAAAADTGAAAGVTAAATAADGSDAGSHAEVDEANPPQSAVGPSSGLPGGGSTESPLLRQLLGDHLDPGYQQAADSATRRSDAASRAWLVAGSVVIGLILAVAFRSTLADAAGTQQARDALVADITAAQAREQLLDGSAGQLRDDVRSAQAAAGGTELGTIAVLEQMNALVAVTGPGLRLTVADPDAATGNGSVLDRDVQLLVNGLWASGAEAIAVGGVRLRSTSAIRQAGGAILVDNRPVLWPLLIEAIGDPNTLYQRLVGTPGFGRFTTFVQLYGISFDVQQVDSLALPAAPSVDPRYLPLPTSTAAQSSHPPSSEPPSSVPPAAVSESTAAATAPPTDAVDPSAVTTTTSTSS